MTETGNIFHASLNLYHTSSTTLTGEEWWASLSAIHVQMFSVGDRSRDRSGRGSNKTPCVAWKVRTRRTASSLLLSCWRISFDRPRRWGTTTGRKLWEIYRSAFKLLSIWTRDVRVLYPMAAQSITRDTRSLSRWRMQTSDERFSRRLQTRIWPSDNCTQNQDLS